LLKFHFISHSLSFGNQKDSRYNEGHTIICKVEDSDIECCLLVTEGDNAQAEALEQGNVFTSTVHVLDYDSLYQRIIFGNEGPLQVLGPSHENESRIDEEAVSENNADRADLIEESLVEVPKENLEQFPDPPLPPKFPDKPLPILLDKNDREGDLQIEDDVDSEIFDDSHGDVVDESVESSTVPSNESLIHTQSREALAILKEKLPTRKDVGARCLSIGAGCLSGCFIKIGIAVTLIGCVAGGEVGLIGLVLIGIGVPLYYYADPKGNDFSLKKGLAKESGDNNSKSNKESHWPVLISLYVTGAFLLFSGAMNGNWILILIGLIIIGISIAYQKVIHDRKKNSS
ncbi:MAG: hypothetical protein VYC70_03845, partial [Verrucomicrobiota bacterium]|nr:hypothetical protein [Verrucomicrobiota bacterium]